MFDIAVIVLAAGLSRRMGKVNKLLIPINGVAMIRVVVSSYLEISDAPVTVVTGFESAKLEAALEGLNINFIYNAAFETGQKTSVVVGLKAAPDAKNTIMALGDQPLLDNPTICEFLQTHLDSDQARITIPVNCGMRGNPLIIPHLLKPRLLMDQNNPGCRKFTRENPNFVNEVTMQSPAFFADIDTPTDLHNLMSQSEVNA